MEYEIIKREGNNIQLNLPFILVIFWRCEQSGTFDDYIETGNETAKQYFSIIIWALSFLHYFQADSYYLKVLDTYYVLIMKYQSFCEPKPKLVTYFDKYRKIHEI